VDPRDRRRDILGAAGPRIGGRQLIGHSDADHSVARGKAHRHILQRTCKIRNSIFAGEIFTGHEQQYRTRSGSPGSAARDIQHVLVVLAVFQAAGKRHALA
jgi:hypothetical protein